MKIYKQYLPLLIFLIGLSGCKKKKNALKNNTTKNGKVATLNIPVAQDTITIADDESIRNFFDHIDEKFVALDNNQNKNGTDTTKNTTNDTQQYAWINNSSKKDQTFETIYFDFDTHAVREDQKAIANNDAANAQLILTEARKNGIEPTIVIEGHACHSAGSAIYNVALSEERAKAVADWFKSQSVPEQNIKIVGRGFEVPAIIAGKAVEGDKQQQWPNRRVEVNVIYGSDTLS